MGRKESHQTKQNQTVEKVTCKIKSTFQCAGGCAPWRFSHVNKKWMNRRMTGCSM